jgi:CubicO group peptidase (beta-lactamase class C family)
MSEGQAVPSDREESVFALHSEKGAPLMHRALIGLTLLASSSILQARADDGPFPVATPADVGIDQAALERLKARAEKAASDAVVIVKDGKLIADWDFGKPRGPIEVMSVTKSIVNLPIGRLIDQGQIESLDRLVCDDYPEWRQGRKAKITIRHLLNHTSGIQTSPFNGEIYNSPDYVQFALAAELSHDPGSHFEYNNKAVDLLAGIVKKASGKRMDEYMRDEIFGPMGITEFTWSIDRAGNPYVLSGAQMRAIDLARIGQMMLDGGTWKGRRIISEQWVRLTTTQPGQPYDPISTLLWWLIRDPRAYAVDDMMISDLKEFGLTEASVKKLEALKGIERDGEGTWASVRTILHGDPQARGKLLEINDRIKKTGRPMPRPVMGPVEGFYAQGSLGQCLVVIPKLRIVAVRQIRSPRDQQAQVDEFGEFIRMVRDLVPTGR